MTSIVQADSGISTPAELAATVSKPSPRKLKAESGSVRVGEDKVQRGKDKGGEFFKRGYKKVSKRKLPTKYFDIELV